MTDHDEAVQIAISVPVYPQTTDEDHARAIVAGLARAGLLARPGELAALRAVAEAGRNAALAESISDVYHYVRTEVAAAVAALAALDAAPAAETTSGEAW